MPVEGLSMKKKHVNELQKSRTMPNAALKEINMALLEKMVANLNSSESSYWLPITVWLCGLISGEDPPIVELVEKHRVDLTLLLFLTLQNFPELKVEAAKALKYLSRVPKLTIDQTQDAKFLPKIEFVNSDVTKMHVVQAGDSTHDALRCFLYSENGMVLRHACCSLAVLSGWKDVIIRGLIRESGLYHRLLDLTRHPTLSGPALRILGNMVLEDDCLIEFIIGDDVLAHLASFLGHINVDVRNEACWILTYIAAGNRQTQLLEKMVAKLKSSDSSYWLPITVWLRVLLSGDDPPIKEVLEKHKVAPTLLVFLTVQNFPELQLEAAEALKYLSGVPKLTTDQTVVAKALTKIEFGTSDVTKVAIVQTENSTHDALRRLLYSKKDMVLRHACCSLAVLSGCKNVKIRELIRESGLYHRLLELTRHPTLVVAALRTLGNIVLGDDCLIECIIRDNVVTHLASFLSHINVDVRKETCWILTYIAAGNRQGTQAIINAGLITPLVNAVKFDEFAVMEAAVWAISKATSDATSDQIKFMVSENCIELLCRLFCIGDSEIFKVSLEGLENILKAGEQENSGDRTKGNPYVEVVQSIRGWTVLEVASQRYGKKLLKKGLKLMVKYGTMSRSSFEKHMSCDDYGSFYYDSSGED